MSTHISHIFEPQKEPPEVLFSWPHEHLQYLTSDLFMIKEMVYQFEEVSHEISVEDDAAKWDDFLQECQPYLLKPIVLIS